jgi:hypothetical protein
MGYTHYIHNCQPTKKLTEEAFAIIKEIIEDYERRGIVEVYTNVFGEKLLTPEEISFNGIGEESCENLYYVAGSWSPFYGRNLGFSFVKTWRHPYDDCVMDVLLVLSHFDDTLYLSSDGEVEWKPAFERIEKKYGLDLSVQRDMIFYKNVFSTQDRKLKYFEGRISKLPKIEYETDRYKATKNLPLEERMNIINEEVGMILGNGFVWETRVEKGQIKLKLLKTPGDPSDPESIKEYKEKFADVFSEVAYYYTNEWINYKF